jgi:hypothetical protein
MTKRSLWMWMVGFLLLAATPALAAGGAHDQGSWELALNSDFDQGFSPAIAYYIADNLALITQAAYSQDEIDVSGTTLDTTQTSFGAGLEFNIPTGGPVVPFVGVLLVYASQEEDASGGVIGDLEVSGPVTQINAGLKLMANERSSVNIFVSYLTGSLESTIDGATGPDADVTGVSAGLGFSLYFP